jgi:hypothetical protein
LLKVALNTIKQTKQTKLVWCMHQSDLWSWPHCFMGQCHFFSFRIFFIMFLKNHRLQVINM